MKRLLLFAGLVLILSGCASALDPIQTAGRKPICPLTSSNYCLCSPTCQCPKKPGTQTPYPCYPGTSSTRMDIEEVQPPEGIDVAWFCIQRGEWPKQYCHPLMEGKMGCESGGKSLMCRTVTESNGASYCKCVK